MIFNKTVTKLVTILTKCFFHVGTLSYLNKKASREGDISVNILKDTIYVYLSILTKIVNSSIEQYEFPSNLKLADFLPIFKEKDTLNKENYRSVNLQSLISKVFEKLLFKQIENFKIMI